MTRSGQKARLAGVMALTLMSCATSGKVRQPVTSTGGVTAERIRIAGGSSALDGVRLLRPNGMLRPHREHPVVYLDGVRLTRPESLRFVHVSSLKSMRYLDAATATIRYGTGHTGGAIVVETHRGR